MKFVRHISRDWPFLISMGACLCRLFIVLLHVPTFASELCQLYCLEVQFGALGFQLVLGLRKRRQFKASHAEFVKERDVLKFWSDKLLLAMQEHEALETGMASWADKKESEERCRNLYTRWERETSGIMAKWRREMEEDKAK